MSAVSEKGDIRLYRYRCPAAYTDQANRQAAEKTGDIRLFYRQG
jgi:hypothetical protein